MVYVDYDPIVLAHARALLDSSESGATEYIDADLRDTGTILARAADLLDFTKPVEEWRPEPGAVGKDSSTGWGAVGRKR